MIFTFKSFIQIIFIASFIISTLFSTNSIQQDNFIHQNPMIGIVGEDIELTLTMITEIPIYGSIIHFRERGENNWQEIRMRMRGNKWDGTIPGNVLTPN